MNKLHILSLLICSLFLTQCASKKTASSKPSKSVIKEGVVQYDITKEVSADMEAMLSSLGTQVNLTFNEQFIHQENTPQLIGKQFYITEIATGKEISYLDAMGKKFAIAADKPKAEATFKPSKETKMIAGLLCHKAIATVNGQETEIYYTKQIAANYSPLGKLEGFTMQYTRIFPFGKITYTAKNFTPKSIAPDFFKAPEGYKSVTPLQLQRELMGDENGMPTNQSLAVGKPLAPFQTIDIDGKTINSETLKGKVLVMNFWFVACKPCQMEMPQLNNLRSKYKDNPNVVFLAITFDNKEKVQAFLSKTPFTYQQIISAKPIIAQYNVMAYPTNVIVGKDGNILEAKMGYSDTIDKELDKFIEMALK